MQNVTASRRRLLGVICVLSCIAVDVSAQQISDQLRDTVTRRAYRDVAELLASLPRTAPPVFDEARTLWLGALPLSCLDRLQPRPGTRAVARATTTADTSRGGTSVSRNDSSSRSDSLRGGTPPSNNGAGYFWEATYTVVHDHGRVRAFWGCNDWHSAVSSTWATVRLLRHFPGRTLDVLAREKLNAHLGKANLDGELAFFRATAAAINPIPSASQSGLFEQPFGFAWLLKLHAELLTWRDADAKRWATNVAPLARWMTERLITYSEKLVEPVRSGGQTNTAQSLTIALDYAMAAGDARLRSAVVSAARRAFAGDTACATQTERVVAIGIAGAARGAGTRMTNADSAVAADSTTRLNDLTIALRDAPPRPTGGGGAVVVSPCLAEAALMGAVLAPREYGAWLSRFLPPFESARFSPLTEPAIIPEVSRADSTAARSATDIERARLAGLSFARAQAMERIAGSLPQSDARVAVLRRLSPMHAARGFELMREYSAGITWLPAQALLYEAVRTR